MPAATTDEHIITPVHCTLETSNRKLQK